MDLLSDFVSFLKIPLGVVSAIAVAGFLLICRARYRSGYWPPTGQDWLLGLFFCWVPRIFWILWEADAHSN